MQAESTYRILKLSEFKWYGWNKNIEYYNPNKKCKILIVFDDLIVDMPNKKRLNLIVTELFIRDRKLNISFVIITQSYLVVPNNIRLNSTRFFITKISNKPELHLITSNHWSDFRDFMNLYRKYTAKPYPFLVIDATLALNNPLHFRKNLLERI